MNVKLDTTTQKAAIYHFTDGSEKRPKIYINQLNQLEEYAISKGFAVTEVFCDKSLLRCEHPEFDRFLSSCEQFDVLVTKDFYHISKNTIKCMSIIKELHNKGINVYTLENGNFTWDVAPFEVPLKIATYTCCLRTENQIKQNIQIQNDIFKLFTKKKTKWTIIDQYSDEIENQNNGEQIQLKKIIENKEKYDLILVHNMNDIHWRTTNFCKVREQLHLDIYSLQEGFLKYKEVII